VHRPLSGRPRQRYHRVVAARRPGAPIGPADAHRGQCARSNMTVFALRSGIAVRLARIQESA
jgi:hypothetical protein